MQRLRNTPTMLALLAGLAGLAGLAAMPSGHAFTPFIALTPEQLSITASRHQLPAASKLECAALDTRLPQLTQTVRRAKRDTADAHAAAVQRLAEARARFTALRC